MDKVINVLHLEDNPEDAKLISAFLKLNNIEANIILVDDERGFIKALDNYRYDIILADFTLPNFDGFSALKIVREVCPDIPFLFVSGTIGEEAAIEAMREGAIDYVLKDRMTRLAPAVKRAIAEAETEKEKKKAEELLQESEKKYRTLVNEVSDGFYIIDINGIITFSNLALAKMLGFEDYKEIIGRPFYDFIPLNKMDEVAGRFRRAIENKESYDNFELELLHKDGKIVYIEGNSSIIIEDNNILGFRGVIRDVTKRKKSEELNRLQTAVMEATANAIIITDRNGVILWVNPAFTALAGYTPEEAIGKNPRILKSGKHVQAFYKNMWDSIIAGKVWRGEVINQRKDGSLYTDEQTITPLLNERGEITHFITIKQDITERKKAEKELNKLSSAVNQTVDTVLITNVDGIIEYVNPAFENLTGYTKEEVLGKTPRILKSGIKDQKYYEELWETILSGRVFFAEITNKKKNGDLYYEAKTISPIFDKSRNITHFVATGKDLTERKQYEEELIKAKEKAEESDRLKSAFLANMSHEIRTPLSAIMGFGQLLSGSELSDEERKDFADVLLKSSRRLLDLINNIIDISKIESGHMDIRKSIFNFNDLIKELHKFYEHSAKNNGIDFNMHFELNDEDSLIESDEQKVHQILLNLLNNAFKFTSTGKIDFGYELREKELTFYVKDTGIGISKEYLPHIFERFHQEELGIDRPYEGAGIGLSIVKGFVDLLDCDIWAESEKDSGSTFYFKIPFNKINMA